MHMPVVLAIGYYDEVRLSRHWWCKINRDTRAIWGSSFANCHANLGVLA